MIASTGNMSTFYNEDFVALQILNVNQCYITEQAKRKSRENYGSGKNYLLWNFERD